MLYNVKYSVESKIKRKNQIISYVSLFSFITFVSLKLFQRRVMMVSYKYNVYSITVNSSCMSHGCLKSYKVS